MRWEVHAVSSGAISPDNLAQASAQKNSGEGVNLDSFTVPPGVKTAVISLVYARPLGETRLEGTFLLKKVTAAVV
jgi:hypothetical protein